MQASVKSGDNKYDVKIEVGEIVNVKGAIFKVCSMSLQPLKFELQPASYDDTSRFMQETQPENLKAPKLVEPQTQIEKALEKTADSGFTPMEKTTEVIKDDTDL